jgi:hypothetical protein
MYQDAPLSQGYLLPKQVLPVTTMIGHVFSVHKVTNRRDEQEERPIVDYFAVHGLQHDLSPHNRLETCEMDPSQCKLAILCAHIPAVNGVVLPVCFVRRGGCVRGP